MNLHQETKFRTIQIVVRIAITSVLTLPCAIALAQSSSSLSLPNAPGRNDADVLLPVTDPQPTTGAQATSGAPKVEPTQPTEKYNIWMQNTYISDWSADTRKIPYAGQNTFRSGYQKSHSISDTVAIGYRINDSTIAYFDSETTEGYGLNNNVGVIGFMNQENFRTGSGGIVWNPARMIIEKTFSFGKDKEYISSGANQLAGYKVVKRVTVMVGKFALTDYFDKNDASHDGRTQFQNWVLVDNGAYDFMSDTHGYTWGGVVDINQKTWAARFAMTAAPIAANGPDFDGKLGKAHGFNGEIEKRYTLMKLPGTIRVLGFSNETRASSYNDIVKSVQANPDLIYNSANAPRDGKHFTNKSGLGVSIQQQISSDTQCFVRLGWNDGKTETWAFTEADRSASAGCIAQGHRWKRDNDQFGAAFFASGMSAEHVNMLNQHNAAGFIVGDGKINYAPELGQEYFYTVNMRHGLKVTADYQRFQNPGGNSDMPGFGTFAIRVHHDLKISDFKTLFHGRAPNQK